MKVTIIRISGSTKTEIPKQDLNEIGKKINDSYLEYSKGKKVSYSQFANTLNETKVKAGRKSYKISVDCLKLSGNQCLVIESEMGELSKQERLTCLNTLSAVLASKNASDNSVLLMPDYYVFKKIDTPEY